MAVAAGADWHTRTSEEVAARLSTGPRGLGADEAAARLERHGPNVLPETPPTSALVVLLHQFTSPLISILVVAAVITILLGDYIDAGVIAAVLVLNAMIEYTQERRAENSVRALMRLMAPRAHVIRGGREREAQRQWS